MAEYKCIVMAIGAVPGMGGDPPDDPGKGSAVFRGGDYANGYKPVQGTWKPNGVYLGLFASEKRAQEYLDSPEGQLWKTKVRDIIQILVEA